MPKFSVVIPCYNCADTIGATLAALQAQSITDWEAICIDDGSTDQTLTVLTDHAQEDPRIRVLQQRNAGPSLARNAGVAAAQAELVAFLDSDDLWSQDKLASAWEIFRSQPETGAVYGQIAFFEDGVARQVTSTVRPGFASISDFLGENPVCTLSNLTVNRRMFLESGGFDETMRHSEDLEWLIRAMSQGLSIVGTADLHVQYRTSQNGLSSDLLAMHDGWRRAIASAGPVLSREHVGAAEAVHLRYLARRALRTGAAPSIALSLALRGLKIAPSAFLGDRHRGPFTLLGCLLAPLTPAGLRRHIFA